MTGGHRGGGANQFTLLADDEEEVPEWELLVYTRQFS
jgi:hypothetical protein